ncbi:MAG: hypothetical protein ACM3KR_05075 [Deltaproteobacteria bacterium]
MHLLKNKRLWLILIITLVGIFVGNIAGNLIFDVFHALLLARFLVETFVCLAFIAIVCTIFLYYFKEKI